MSDRAARLPGTKPRRQPLMYLNVRVPLATYDRIEARAKAAKVPRGTWLRELIERWTAPEQG